jgi:hypothetical protein
MNNKLHESERGKEFFAVIFVMEFYAKHGIQNKDWSGDVFEKKATFILSFFFSLKPFCWQFLNKG